MNIDLITALVSAIGDLSPFLDKTKKTKTSEQIISELVAAQMSKSNPVNIMELLSVVNSTLTAIKQLKPEPVVEENNQEDAYTPYDRDSLNDAILTIKPQFKGVLDDSMRWNIVKDIAVDAWMVGTPSDIDINHRIVLSALKDLYKIGYFVYKKD